LLIFLILLLLFFLLLLLLKQSYNFRGISFSFEIFWIDSECILICLQTFLQLIHLEIGIADIVVGFEFYIIIITVINCLIVMFYGALILCYLIFRVACIVGILRIISFRENFGVIIISIGEISGSIGNIPLHFARMNRLGGGRKEG